MKIISFKAKEVHGYLNFDINFNNDINFIAGLNGSGKTTVLTLLMAILTPSFKDLANISFRKIELCIEERNRSLITIWCNRDKERITLGIGSPTKKHGNKEDDIYSVEMSELDFRESFNYFRKSNFSKILSKLPSPMFLSLDRRFIKRTRDDERYIKRNRHGEFTSHDRNIFDSRSSTNDESLNEILKIVSDFSSESRSKQVSADKRLRNNIILDSFNLHRERESHKVPNRKNLAELRHKQIAIKKTLDTLDVPSEEFEQKYEQFFDKLETLVEKLSNKDKEQATTQEINEYVSEWFVNQNQLERINRLFLMVEKYQTDKGLIYKKLNDFESLVNKFLKQTGKKIRVDHLGNIKIKIKNKERELSILSSGERQILIMFAHLILNKRLPKDGIFIIDEPELSLHLSWQDMFVESIQKASPKLQIILATHSPAIIGGRNNMYVSLNGGI